MAGLNFIFPYLQIRYPAENNFLSLAVISFFLSSFHLNFIEILSNVKQDNLNKQNCSWTSLEKLSLEFTEQSLADAFDANFFGTRVRKVELSAQTMASAIVNNTT